MMIRGFPFSPALNVASVSLVTDGIVPFRTPILTSASVRWRFSFWLSRFPFNVVALNFCRHALLFFCGSLVVDWNLQFANVSNRVLF